MESRSERGAEDPQRAKLIFISLGAVVMILLVFSYVSGNRARNQRNAALKEVEALKLDNAKLSQWLEERTQEVEKYKKAYSDCKTKPTTAAKKPSKKPKDKKTATKRTGKKKTTK